MTPNVILPYKYYFFVWTRYKYYYLSLFFFWSELSLGLLYYSLYFESNYKVVHFFPVI